MFSCYCVLLRLLLSKQLNYSEDKKRRGESLFIFISIDSNRDFSWHDIVTCIGVYAFMILSNITRCILSAIIHTKKLHLVYSYNFSLSGFLPRVIKVAPACAIMISTYEFGKTFFRKHNEEQRGG